MTIVSNALKELFVKAGSKAEKLICAVPVNMRFPSKSLDDVKLSNNISSTKLEFPLFESIEDCTKMKKILSKNLSLKRLQANTIVLSLCRVLGNLYGSLMVQRFFKNVEVIISNTQGAREPVYFCDRKVLEVSAWGPTCYKAPIIIYISSYNLTTKVQITADPNMGIKLTDLIETLNTQIDGLIEKYA